MKQVGKPNKFSCAVHASHIFGVNCHMQDRAHYPGSATSIDVSIQRLRNSVSKGRFILINPSLELVFYSQSEANVKLIHNKLSMSNYYSLRALQTNMADACEEPSSDCSDSTSGNNSSFNTEGSSSGENLQYKEIRVSYSSTKKRKSYSQESNSSWKRSAKKTKQVSGNSNFSGKDVSKNYSLCENAVAPK